MCVYLWPYMGAKLELHIPSVSTLVTLAIYPQGTATLRNKANPYYVRTTGTLRELFIDRNCNNTIGHALCTCS